MKPKRPEVRHLHLVCGDQLDADSAVFRGFDPAQDAVWMAEVHREATHVWCHRQRLAFFFAAMRHFRDELRARGFPVHYQELPNDPAEDRGPCFSELLTQDIRRLRPCRLIAVQPGDARVQDELQTAARDLGLPLEIREDQHFFDSPGGFAGWAEGRKVLVLEHYYRRMRKQHEILLDAGGNPEGGQWNYDPENRESFGKDGPPSPLPRIPGVQPDELTRSVLQLVSRRFGRHPGALDGFNLPVSRRDALAWLDDFIEHRLPLFGRYQDALWGGEPFLYHSRLSCLLNVKLLSPRECVDRAVAAYRSGQAPLASVEGFVRQILGWREYVRGIYWLHMPGYLDRNFLEAEADLPPFYWTGDTGMACLRDALQQVVSHGYAHHIQRLMVLGLFALLYGVQPRQFHNWHMAMYLDAIDWVSAPNVIGMSQFADGGIVGTKPYCASGNYISRMSNHCASCRYDPKQTSGPQACPFSVLYWDFLARNHAKLHDNRRLKFQFLNLRQKQPADLEQIDREVGRIRSRPEAL